ncbi:hypothetical protein BGZ63DRAFT_463733 [Mariannaea sp. PMI_226]|nr:hypothetical protein BGZ63DRAFT_463733 [Mariannaea sp. PMI_226]
MGAKAAERMARISDLSLSHQSNAHKIDLVNRDEEARRLKLRLLSLRDENASLKDKLSQKDSRISLLSRQGEDFRTELSEAREKSKLQDTRIKKQSNELAALKPRQAELEALNGSMEDSSKVLQEKFALNRELNRIRPEMEHLKSQLANHQVVIIEKHELERQLNSLEVELENEKRSKQRIQQKMDNEADEGRKAHLDVTEKKYANEKKEWEREKKKFESELREMEGEREQLEDRVSGLKSKLKSVQTELKETRSELAGCREELEAARKVSRTVDRPKKVMAVESEAARKRRLNDISMEDMSIGTPGPDLAAQKRPLKKRAAEYALVGEKSAFSVTPFLSRTKAVDDDSINVPSPTGKQVEFAEPVADREEEEDEEEENGDVSEEPRARHQISEETVEVRKEESKKSSHAKASKPRGRPRKALDEAPTLKKNMPSSSTQQKMQGLSKLSVLAEESEDVEANKVTAKRAKKGLELKTKNNDSKFGNDSFGEAEGRKKKRKILAGSSKTLFDDDDAEVAPRLAKPKLGVGRKLKAPLGGASNAFAGKTFSPLKRDRRGVGASFLV